MCAPPDLPVVSLPHAKARQKMDQPEQMSTSGETQSLGDVLCVELGFHFGGCYVEGAIINLGDWLRSLGLGQCEARYAIDLGVLPGIIEATRA
jgi:hypothetical protein